MDAARLRSIPLFASLSERELEKVARYADEIDIAPGKHLMDQGRLGYEFFVIEEGTAEVTRDGEALRTLGPGDFFGEIALLETDRRTATVVAASPMLLIVMHARDFRRLTEDQPDVASKIRWAISERPLR